MYSEEQRASIQAEVCERIANGQSLASIVRDDHMPNYSTITDWLNAEPAFAAKYARARDAQADKLAEEIIDIVDEEYDPARARVRMDARKWYAGKLRPKKYGDSSTLELNGKDGGPIQTSLVVKYVEAKGGGDD